jgi:formamidopyrimidine-DNA glycosylase
MPELPEVQAHAERLTSALRGVALDGFDPLTFTALKTFDPPPGKAVGVPLSRVDRRGKHLLLGFGELTFVVHLMQGGRLRWDEKQARKPRGGVARWRFADGRALLLTEQGTERRVGVWVVAGDPLAAPPLDDLGPEADTLDADALAALFAAHSMRLHTFLRDQRILAGLGRRLADEVCWHARLSPFAQTRGLGSDAAETVVAAVRATVDEGLAADRARDDMSASRDRPAAVHNRAGSPCPRCGDTVRAVEYRDYTVNYCPRDQTGGRILADNTTSKFLK